MICYHVLKYMIHVFNYCFFVLNFLHYVIAQLKLDSSESSPPFGFKNIFIMFLFLFEMYEIYGISQCVWLNVPSKGCLMFLWWCCSALFTVDSTVKPRRLTEDLWSLIRSWQVPAFCPKDGHPTNQLRYRGHVRWCHPSGWCAQRCGAGLARQRWLHLLDGRHNRLH